MFDTRNESVITHTVPVLNGILSIDEEGIPRLTVPVPLAALQNDISSLPYTPCYICDGVVRVGSMCLNHPN